MKVKCHQCGAEVSKKPSDCAPKGVPRKHSFCSQLHYEAWKASEHLRVKAEWLRFQREVWGSTPAGRRDPKEIRFHGRVHELIARDDIMPAIGFTEIDDFSGMSNMFYIDFIATYENERVLVDATVKLKAYIPEKIRLARSLRMRLFILHIAPANPTGLFWLNEVPAENHAIARVPAAFIRERAAAA